MQTVESKKSDSTAAARQEEKKRKSPAFSFLSLEPLFWSLLITDFLSPFFIWPHWTGRFYAGWPEFFGSGLSHWLQAWALLLAWPVLQNKLWARLWLVLTAGFHLFLPPPSLGHQLAAGLAAVMGWWLTALPAILAAGRAFSNEVRPGPTAAGSGPVQVLAWLALAANLALVLILLGPVLPLALEGSEEPLSELVRAVLTDCGLFLALLALIFLPGRRLGLFSAPVGLAALISLGGIWRLSPDSSFSQEALGSFLTGLRAIHFTLLPVLGELLLIAALIVLILRRRPAGFRLPPLLVRPGRLPALALLPIAGLGLAVIPLWADHISRACLSPPPLAETPTLRLVGPLALPIPVSLKVSNWATFINKPTAGAAPEGLDSVWPPPAKSGRGGRFQRETFGLILIEAEAVNPALAGQEFEEAWQSRLKRAPDREGYPKIVEDLSDQFAFPSRLLIHFYPPRHQETKGSMIMRLSFFQRRPGGYLRLMEAVKIETENQDPATAGLRRAALKADFLQRAGEAAAAYHWGRPELGPGREAVFATRFGWLDSRQLAADLEVKFQLSKVAGRPGLDWRGRDRTEIRLRSRHHPERESSSDNEFSVPPARPEIQTGEAPLSPAGRAAERLEPLLGLVRADRARLMLSRGGLERIYISMGGAPSSPAAINAVWSSFEHDLEVELRSGRRLVKADLPPLVWLWAAIPEGPDRSAGAEP